MPSVVNLKANFNDSGKSKSKTQSSSRATKFIVKKNQN